MHIEKLLLENTAGGRIRATATNAAGESVSKSFRGVTFADIVNGHAHPAQLDDWQKVKDDAAASDAPSDAPDVDGGA